MNDDLNGRQSRERDEAKNATGWRFCARSHENRKPKEAAMPRHAATIFSEVKRGGKKTKSTRLFVTAPRPNPLCSTRNKNHRFRWFLFLSALGRKIPCAAGAGFDHPARRSESSLPGRRARVSLPTECAIPSRILPPKTRTGSTRSTMPIPARVKVAPALAGALHLSWNLS